jgi:alanine dehydrogenase
LGRPANYIMGKGDEPIYDHDPKEGLAEDLQRIRSARKSRLDLADRPDLGELVSGHVQPPPYGGITCFVNVIGLGLQFAALGALAHQKAKAGGIGREIPTHWLLENEHP